uniref:COG0553: Superfamily II DNA/RNA helicases, SNF2 family n=1 Tax=uncultured Thiotrichaceae bacterium TaxID=298394 RepID=A0A6S6TPW1_9GAMM|nr:MAG: COG0553: Superfamily II DNA/RNA helicases, SNF2 family [uncultured Thiotrichaceae bacterium]
MNKETLTLLNQHSINVLVLQNSFGGQTIKRGINYYKSNLVEEIWDVVEIDGGKIMKVSGSVFGSGSSSYETDVTLHVKDSSVIVRSECSCPVGYNCKHGIALLFFFLHAMQDEEEAFGASAPITHAEITPELDEWLEAINTEQNRDPVAEKQAEAERTEYHVLYLLDIKPDLRQEKTLQVTPVKVRRLKAGGYGKEYRLESYHLLNDPNRLHSPNLYYDENDVAIFRKLSTQQSTGFYHGYSGGPQALEKESGGQLLLKIISSGRCYWQTQKADKPLSIGADRNMTLNWQAEGKNKRITLDITPPATTLLPLGDIYYLDLEQQEVGQLMHESLSQKQIKYFLKAPPVPVEKAEALTRKILHLFPDTEVPLPEPIEITNIEITGQKPRFHLHLHATDVPALGQQSSHTLHIASLTLQYGDTFYQPQTLADTQQALTTKLEGTTRYRIHRDIETEQTAFQRLRDYGFSSLDPNHTPYGVFDMIMLTPEGLQKSVEQWDHFKSSGVPLLEAEGWEVTIDESFKLKVDTSDDWHAELEESEGGDWFELSLGFELDGQRVNLLPLVVKLLAADNHNPQELHRRLQEQEYQLLQISDHHWVKVPCKRLLTVLDTLIELYSLDSLNADGNIEFSKFDGMHYGELLNDPGLRWKGAKELKQLNRQLQSFDGIEAAELPKGLQATLREYQQDGYNWLTFMQQYQFNGILADDMGLGKTLQTLSILLAEKESGRANLPSLVIAPTSLMSNWRREVEKFAPALSVLVLQGQHRKGKFGQLTEHDIVLTTYPLIIRDKEVYEKQEFHYLILDEAQAIKNAKAKSTQQIYSLKSNHRLCLSGTPIENHLGELWSMFHFLMPGYLGTQERFNRLFRYPIEKHGNTARGEQLRKRTQPFMLRRTKDVVAKELPEKTEIIRSVPLSGKQRDLYETVRLAMDKKVRDEISKKGLARSHIMILDALLKLRQVCCDPQLVKLDKARSVKESAKFELLMSMVPEMVEEGRKILIFSQFTTMLGIIEKALRKQKIPTTKLTGQTRKREEAISHFQEGDAAVFLISLKAGGTGLNLTAADTVIHYDPWWNPAVEQQATDRAYRLGQDKPVFVYKLLTEETVEEKILQLQAKKQALADSMYGSSDQDLNLGQNDLLDLLKPLI